MNMRMSWVPFICINLYDLEQYEFLTILLLTLFGSLPRNESWDSERRKLLFTLNFKVSSLHALHVPEEVMLRAQK